MDIIDIFIQDLYAQMFYNGTFINPTRFFIIAALIQDGEFKKCYTRQEIEKVVFEFYADNDDIAKRHPRNEIRNIKKHGIDIIKEELQVALDNWVSEAKSDFLSFDLKNIYLKVNGGHSEDIPYVQMILEELFNKTFHCTFPFIGLIVGEDQNIDVFGNGPYKNHLTAEMQYCVCCDEYNLERLVAVHILCDKDSAINDSRIDVNNGLLMCREHAQEYLHGRFYFNEQGKVVNVSSCIIQKNMRLGRTLLTEKRKKYLKEAYKKKSQGEP